MTTGKKFRQILAKNGLVEAMATHSPLSAMLAAEAGFDAIWASGFELSAMYGVPDVSVVSMTQHLDMTRAMADRSGLPVVADIDTGFGNAINVLYAIEQYERAGAAAIVMEDKSFPKVTSLIAGGRQDMVRIEEFQGKIEAALAARRDPDLVIVARTEALIAGLKSGHIRAAGLDVYDGEPKVNPGYLTLENVTLLPHLGSATIETRDAMGHRALDNLDAVLLKGTAAPDRVA